jgi:hypothetical protein
VSRFSRLSPGINRRNLLLERENLSAGGLSQTKNSCGEATKSLTELWKARLLGEILLKTWKRKRERESQRKRHRNIFLEKTFDFLLRGIGL